jgi:3-deoxy-D-manno-octulosonic-acid transferase
MQSEIDRMRIESMGADPKRVTVFGNLKYDAKPSRRALEPKFAAYLKNWGDIWIAASTMPGEDEIVLDAYRRLKESHPRLKLLIAPRHPERAGEIEEMARSRGTTVVRRSRLENGTDVLVLDTIGELAAAFEYAQVVFMGGSLVPRGGHNILEPARHAKPIIFGPHMENFRDISRLFVEANGAMQIQNPDELAPAVARLLDDADLASALGGNGHRVVLENTGATDRVLSFIRKLEES